MYYTKYIPLAFSFDNNMPKKKTKKKKTKIIIKFSEEASRTNDVGSRKADSKQDILEHFFPKVVSILILKYEKETIENIEYVYDHWTTSLGKSLVKDMSISVGGDIILPYNAEWLNIWNQLFIKPPKLQKNMMI